LITTPLPAHALKDAVTKENASKPREGRNELELETVYQELHQEQQQQQQQLLQNPVEQKMVKNANFHSFIKGKNTKLVLRILTIQMKLGVQPEQTEMENMLEEVDIMDSVRIIVQQFNKNQ
jgi:hypothetical protein